MSREFLLFISGVLIGIAIGYTSYCEFNVKGAPPGHVVVMNLNHEHAMQMKRLIENTYNERRKDNEQRKISSQAY